MKIYYAAPLHDEADRERNKKYVAMLRGSGHLVFSPGENGVWEEMVRERVQAGASEENAVEDVRKMLFKENDQAIRQCQCVVANCGEREPSEGMLWEMGYAAGLQKPVVLCNFHDWRFNLMPQFGSMVVTSSAGLLTQLESIEGYINEQLRGVFK